MTCPGKTASARIPAGQQGRCRDELAGTNDCGSRRPPELAHRPCAELVARVTCSLTGEKPQGPDFARRERAAATEGPGSTVGTMNPARYDAVADFYVSGFDST